ncbi:20308_t:CDS:2, partial [Racocetra persica]
ETQSKFYIDILTGAIDPERNMKTTNLWDFLRSYIGEKNDHYFLKAMKYYYDKGNITIKNVTSMERKLLLSPKYYNWVLLNFKSHPKVIFESFNDILETRVSIDINLQENNVVNETNSMICDTFKVYCQAYCYTEGLFLPSQLKIISKAASEDVLDPLFKCYLHMVFEIKQTLTTFDIPPKITDDMNQDDTLKVENATLVHNQTPITNGFSKHESQDYPKQVETMTLQNETAAITEDIPIKENDTKRELQEQWYKELKKYNDRTFDRPSKFNLYLKEFWQILIETEIGRELREREKDIEKSSNPRMTDLHRIYIELPTFVGNLKFRVESSEDADISVVDLKCPFL